MILEEMKVALLEVDAVEVLVALVVVLLEV